MLNSFRKFLRSFLKVEDNVRTKIFIILNGIGFLAMSVAILTDIIIGEHPVEIIALIITGILSFIITIWASRNDKIQIAANIMAACIVIIIVPIAFYFGGGPTGGGIIWYSYAYLYVGIILVGAMRWIMLSLLTVNIVGQFVICYLFPDYIPSHDKLPFFVDVCASVLLVGISVFFMVLIQHMLYLEESEKSKERAKKIEELNRAQNRFFSSMSHEIRTPINTIIGLNELTLRENISPEVTENAKNIQAASKILLSLINDILDMSKIESGKMDIVKVQYDVGKMLSEIVNMIWIKANEKGLKFTISVDPTMPSQLFSDEVRIKQILINLLNNAVKYTKEGHVSLSVHCTRTEGGKALVSYSVEDSGMGIRKESIPHLFDAFRREDEEKNRYIEGTGLGLSIVKQLVDLLGGSISVNSVYTKGSTFVVSIEQEIVDDSMLGDFDSHRENAAKDTYQYHQSFEAPEARILIVDDNSTNLMVAKKLLKATKVMVDTAESGEKALGLTLQHEYHVILMDHLMPVMDGIECLHAIRAQAGGLSKDTPIVALTANAGSENQALYKREGFDAYLMKPVDSAELESTIRKLLPQKLVKVSQGNDASEDNESIYHEIRRKIPIVITTESTSDLPAELIEKFNIPVIPFKVHINEGVFYDGLEAGNDTIVRSMQDTSIITRSEVPSVAEYEDFFSDQLTHAQHIIHISSAKSIGDGYANACEGALAFYNVRVVDSGLASGGLGLLVMYAKTLTETGMFDPDQIVEALEEKKDKISTSYIINNTDYLYRSGKLSNYVHKICAAFMLHPIVEARNSSLNIRKLWAGSFDKISSKYIKSLLKHPGEIDKSVLFITYSGLMHSEIEEIQKEIETYIHFDKIYVQKASPSVSINCGPGTYGLFFMRKN